MSKYKRRKPRSKVKCNICTDNRVGNSGQADRKSDKVRKQKIKEQINENNEQGN